MDTDNLRLFVLAAERLNISAAGRALGMTPAAASTRLAKLEHSLGAELLHRSTRKVSVSIEGMEFLPFAREILAQQDAGLAALGRGNPTITGTLRFAASSTFAVEYIAPLVPDFLDSYPHLKLDLRLSDAPFDLIEGSFDLALRSAPLADSSLAPRRPSSRGTGRRQRPRTSRTIVSSAFATPCPDRCAGRRGPTRPSIRGQRTAG